MKRYDLITNYRCGLAIEEMEPADDGEWVRWEDVQAALCADFKRWARHMPTCEKSWQTGEMSDPPRGCTCGLDAALCSEPATKQDAVDPVGPCPAAQTDPARPCVLDLSLREAAPDVEKLKAEVRASVFREIHDYWEFRSKDEAEFDEWLHAGIREADRQVEALSASPVQDKEPK